MSLMHIPDAVTALERDLRRIFGSRLQSLVVLIGESAPAFAALVTSVAQLDTAAAAGEPGGKDAGAAARHIERRLSLPSTASEIVALAGAGEIPSAAAERLFAPYLETVE